MKKVLIVSYYFPPINMIAAKRYGTMCKYLEEYGYKPYIITTRHDKNCGLNVRLDLVSPVNEEQVIRLGRSRNNADIQGVCGSLLIRIIQNCKITSRTITPSSIGWYEIVKRSISLNILKDIDLIIGTFPPMENLFVARYLSKQLNCPYIVDIRDLISDYAEVGEGYKRSQFIDKILEKYILSGASGIVTVTPGFRDILRKRFPNKPCKVVFNGWDEKTKIETKPEETIKYLYYAGSLYLHRLESFELMMKCIKKINLKNDDKIKFIVRSIGPKELDMKAKAMVQQQNMQEYVSILDAASEDIVKREQRAAYINVVLSTIHEDDVSLMTTIPGKVYELLNYEAPVLAIVPKSSDVDKVLNYTNKGIASTSEDEVIDYILRDSTKYNGNKNTAYFSRKNQAKRLCQFMDKVLGI